MSGQSILDRMTAAKHSLSGQGLAKVVCKATTEEVMGPKKKHLDYLIQCTNEPNVSIPQLADLLIERTQHTNWTIVFKSLITIQNLMNYGNERFTQYLASNNCTFNLSNFIDKAGVQGYDMSTYIRRYSKYLNEKAVSYRSMAFDFCKIRRGKDDGVLRKMNAEKLLKSLPCLQHQLDALIEFDCTPNELTNGVMNACFLLLFKDLIRLFACYNDGVINLLEKYFDMNKKQCKDGLECYKRFLVRMDKVGEFLKVAENVGIDKGDIPDLAKAPSSLLDALEQHLASLEGKKGVVSTTKPAGFSTAVDAISGNSSFQISEEEKKKILDEENQRLQQLKEYKLKETGSTATPSNATQSPPSTNPFVNNTNAPDTNSLLGSPISSQSGNASDDLLSLTGNPFVQNVQQEYKLKETGSTATPSNATQSPPSTNPFANNTNAPDTNNLLGSPISSQSGNASDDLLSLTGNPFVQNVQQVMAMNNAVNNLQTTYSPGGWSTPPSQGLTAEVDFTKVFQNNLSTSSAYMAAKGNEMYTLDPLDPLASVSKICSSSVPVDSTLDNLLSGQELMSPVKQVTCSVIPSMVSSVSDSEKNHCKMMGSLHSTSHVSSAVGIDQPMTGIPLTDSGFDAFGEVLKPANTSGQLLNTQTDKLLQKDLDSSLASLAGNLNINPAASVKKIQHEWQPKGEQKKTGGANFQFQGNASSTWTAQPMMTGSSVSQNMMYQQPIGQPLMQPGMIANRPLGMNMQPVMGVQPQAGVYGMNGTLMTQPRPPAHQSMNDPFGAL